MMTKAAMRLKQLIDHREIAERLGVEYYSLSRILSGERKPTRVVRERIARLYGIPVTDWDHDVKERKKR